jgi:hypothetical protein
MTLISKEETLSQLSPSRTEEPLENQEAEHKANPQCVESYQADIFDFCMKTEVKFLKIIDFFGALNYFIKNLFLHNFSKKITFFCLQKFRNFSLKCLKS